MVRHVLRVAAAAWVIGLTMSGLGAQGAAGVFDGRWVVAGDVWFDQMAGAAAGRGGQGRGGAGAPAEGGRGGAGRGAQAPAPDVVLELHVAPNGVVSGRATGVSGRRGAPGSHPAHDIEITRGSLEAGSLRFQIWRFDGYHNRVHVTARPASDGIDLEFRRESPAGPQVFTTRARRAPY